MTAPAKPDPLRVECEKCGAKRGLHCTTWPWGGWTRPHACRVRRAEKEAAVPDLTAKLAAAREVVAKATPGPQWRLNWDERPYPDSGFPWSTFAVGPLHGVPENGDTEEKAAWYEQAAALRNADAALIVLAVNSLPALLDVAEAAARNMEEDAALSRGVDTALYSALARLEAVLP